MNPPFHLLIHHCIDLATSQVSSQPVQGPSIHIYESIPPFIPPFLPLTFTRCYYMSRIGGNKNEGWNWERSLGIRAFLVLRTPAVMGRGEDAGKFLQLEQVCPRAKDQGA